MGDIYIKNARVNNLKHVSLKIPRNRLTVVTGVSGSGKSSLAFDTLYAEGQRRYVESLSAYARQFLERMEKPEVDYIQGLSPAVAIQQRVSTSNPRSTVGTVTEIYEYLKLLYARLGKTFSPVSGKLVSQDTASDVVDYILEQPRGSRIVLLAEVPVRSRGLRAELELALQKGFTRIWEDGKAEDIETYLEAAQLPERAAVRLLIDRVALGGENPDDLRGRLGDSVQTAYQEGNGACLVQIDQGPLVTFSERFEADGMTFERPNVNFFSFNNPYGACKTCEGFGRVLGIDEDLVIPDPSVSVYDGAVAPWRGEVMSNYRDEFVQAAPKADFPLHKAYYDLSPEQKRQLWEGIPGAWGIQDFFEYLGSKMHKIQYRVMLARYRGYTLCPDCQGARIRKDALYVRLGGYHIGQLLDMELEALAEAVRDWSLDERERSVGKRLLHEISSRLDYLIRVGVGYLTLNRKISTLSGGEMQRIRLATSLGSGLTGAMYVLDEPSIGLHPRDTDRLVSILEALRDKGNTLIVVEHDESVMRQADQIVDMGPGAGELGGEVIFNGSYAELAAASTLTADYLSGRREIPVPKIRRKIQSRIRLTGARMHNLKGIDLELPLHALSVVTGVSGSGKTTLIKNILYPALRKHCGEPAEKGGFYKSLEGDLSLIKQVEMVDQDPIGRSARSNPVTYLKAYDHIRELFASQPLAKLKGLKPGHFSFNVEGGRCETCQGEGSVVIEMQFLPDVKLVCDTCGGKRFQKHMLEVTWQDKNIDEVLHMTISEAVRFFEPEKKIAEKLLILERVGLGYLRLGQSTSTLSGGEAQRMKLAFFLSQTAQARNTLYIFDEPTTGLHFEDIRKLLDAIYELIERGNSVLIIEHHPDVIKCADWILDLGPEGGKAGGELLYQGPPEGLLAVERSHTARYLRDKLAPAGKP